MKKYIKFFILTFLLTGGFIFYFTNKIELEKGFKRVLRGMDIMTVCDETLYYSLGSVDSGFEISEAEVLVALQKAESVWEEALGRNLFEYRAGADFKINFIFDERQSRTKEKEKLDKQLTDLAYDKDNLSAEYQEKYALYSQAMATYEKKVENYIDRVEEFNKTVKKLEKNDEMTKEKYDKLKEEEEELADTKESLDQERKRVNNLAQEVNNIVDKESSLIERYNDKVETYRDKFGEAVEFNQGEYNGISINIYQFHSEKDLTLVLAHEFGHALGVGHVENSQSLMYYLMENQDLENIKLSTEDLSAIKEICRLK
ncbi:MAG: matrixin family metalloprotease [Candidatus Moraniibacteriota bacterium]